MNLRIVSLVGALALSGCSTVKSSRVREDYDAVDRSRVKRLVVVTQPLPEGKQHVGDLWSLLARRYVNQKRDFLVRTESALSGEPQDPKFRALCTEGAEGVLWLRPDVKQQGAGVEAGVKAQLLRCSDGEEVWGAEAGSSYDSVDDKFKELTTQYTEELGAEVTPYVAPSFQVLKAALDTLPNPVLSEADVDEKIELGE